MPGRLYGIGAVPISGDASSGGFFGRASSRRDAHPDAVARTVVYAVVTSRRQTSASHPLRRRGDHWRVSTCGARLLQPGKDTAASNRPFVPLPVPIATPRSARTWRAHSHVSDSCYAQSQATCSRCVSKPSRLICRTPAIRSRHAADSFRKIFRMRRARVLCIWTAKNDWTFLGFAGIEIRWHRFSERMGVAPAAGRINSAPPSTHAGNPRQQGLVAGTISTSGKKSGAFFQSGGWHRAR